MIPPKRTAQLALVILLSAVLFFCLPQNRSFAASSPVTIKGQITNSTTGQPVSQAAIKICDIFSRLYAVAHSDGAGNYIISDKKISGICLIFVSAKDYCPKFSIGHLKQGKTYILNFSLKFHYVNQPPKINSLSPDDGTTFLAGAFINIKANASDLDSDPLEYQFSVGGTVEQAWSGADNYTWQTSAPDTGAVSILCEVRDTSGQAVSRAATYHIINPSVSEILQKVSENHALISDKTMDVTVTSEFGGEPFGETIYTRQYFKSPDKQRTDTFPDDAREDFAKTEIQIVVGPDSYLIDPIRHAQVHRNILTDLGLTQEQLNQMDEIYHPSGFLAAHTISRIDNPGDLANGLIMLEVVPNNSAMYSKLGIQIDYFKGLRTRSLTYVKDKDQEKLQETIGISGSQVMPNGAWVPAGQVKTQYFSEGVMITSLDFKNIQINTGLSDSIFDPEGQ